MPNETPVDPAAHLAKLARDARDRLPSIVARIEEIVRAVDPIELLSQLSILNLTHQAGLMPDRDDKAKWQVRIEWLAWLVLARKLEEPTSPQVIDSRVLTPLEGALDDYFNAMTLSLCVPVDGLTADEDRLRASLQLEALVVRGLGLANVGLTVRDAFSVAKAVGALYTAKVSKLRRDAAAVEATVRENPARAAELEEIPPTSPTLAALRGDMAAIASDFSQAILSPLSQAKRARDYILERDEAEFIEETAGRRIVIHREDVSETFLVTVVGSGAWSHIAANLAEFARAGS